jgi:hypothetical protein
MIDYRFAPPPPPVLAVQAALPATGRADTEIAAPVPPVYECVCGALSSAPLPRCQECRTVMCPVCQRQDNLAWCILCGDVNWDAMYYGREAFT